MLYKPYPGWAHLACTSQYLVWSSYALARPSRAGSSPSNRCFARTYAQPSNEPRADGGHQSYEWPSCRRGSAPTPYEILKLGKDAPYSKEAFYQLVKLYHPDREAFLGDRAGGVSREIRLERYRLIVAAHEVLSDPTKRRAYDRWGHGWDGQPQVPRRRSWSASGGDGDHNFYRERSSAAHNATWEDWERWYHRRDPKYKQSPHYTSNENFVGLVLLFIAIGASLELTRASRLSQSFKEQVDAKHAAVSQGLAQRRGDMDILGSQEARVQNFLRVRESGYQDQEPLPSPAPRRSLPPPAGLNSGWK